MLVSFLPLRHDLSADGHFYFAMDVHRLLRLVSTPVAGLILNEVDVTRLSRRIVVSSFSTVRECCERDCGRIFQAVEDGYTESYIICPGAVVGAVGPSSGRVPIAVAFTQVSVKSRDDSVVRLGPLGAVRLRRTQVERTQKNA